MDREATITSCSKDVAWISCIKLRPYRINVFDEDEIWKLGDGIYFKRLYVILLLES